MGKSWCFMSGIASIADHVPGIVICIRLDMTSHYSSLMQTQRVLASANESSLHQCILLLGPENTFAIADQLLYKKNFS